MIDESADAQKPAQRCPTCGKCGETPYRPFCSKRCADVDLARWLKGGYAIPAASDPDDDLEPGIEI